MLGAASMPTTKVIIELLMGLKHWLLSAEALNWKCQAI
jgi:hypothetical protein